MKIFFGEEFIERNFLVREFCGVKIFFDADFKREKFLNDDFYDKNFIQQCN